jgi:hypothetical protein
MSATTRGPQLRRREVGRERQPGGLRRVHADADQQEREGRAELADGGRAVGVARQHDQREGHDRQPAELEERAEPDEGRAAPAEVGAVVVGTEADQRPERREEQRDGDHQADQPRRHVQLDDHHAVERAGEQHRRHADRHLEQRQAHQARERQGGGGGVGERQELRPEPHPSAREAAAPAHRRTSSMAWEV